MRRAPVFVLAEPDLARRAVDVVPPERDDLVLAAPGQQQQTYRRHPRGKKPALRFGLVQHPAERAVFLGRQEPLAPGLRVRPHRAARIAPGRRHPPRLGEPEHLREHADRLVRLGRLVPHPEVQVRHMRTLHRRQRQMAELGHDVAVHNAPEGLHRSRLAVHLDMRLHVACRQVRDGGLRLRCGRERLLAAPDAVEHARRVLARLVGRHLAVRAERGAFHAARQPPHLHHVDLAPRRIHPDAEAGQVAVPEHRVAALDPQRVHRALGNPDRVSCGHESVRSKGDDDEDDDSNSAFCRASAALALCHRLLHHRVTERFRGHPGSWNFSVPDRKHIGTDRCHNRAGYRRWRAAVQPLPVGPNIS